MEEIWAYCECCGGWSTFKQVTPPEEAKKLGLGGSYKNLFYCVSCQKQKSRGELRTKTEFGRKAEEKMRMLTERKEVEIFCPVCKVVRTFKTNVYGPTCETCGYFMTTEEFLSQD